MKQGILIGAFALAAIAISYIPESFIKKEAEHVEGFAPELAVVPAMPEPPAPLDVTPPAPVTPEPEEPAGKVGRVHQGATYGEPLLREILGAKPVDDMKSGR